MKHVDALSRQLVSLPFDLDMIKHSDWVECVQSQDDLCLLIHNQFADGSAEDCYSIIDNKICKTVNGDQKTLANGQIVSRRERAPWVPQDLRRYSTKVLVLKND